MTQKIESAGCRSGNDIALLIKTKADELLSSASGCRFLLIDGDVADTFDIFELFVDAVAHGLTERGMSLRVIFTLGNHEFWAGSNYGDVVMKYRIILNKYGMILLHNDLLCLYADGCSDIVLGSEFSRMSDSQVGQELGDAEFIILGGTGFSGCSVSFNADCGVYMDTISRELEVRESIVFESLYRRVEELLSDKNVIVMTHMPKSHWCYNTAYHEGFLYIEGHTHQNRFRDNGQIHVYADNQIGYDDKYCTCKTLLINTKCRN